MELQDQWGVSGLHGTHFTANVLSSHPFPRCPSVLAGVCSSSIAGHPVSSPAAGWEGPPSATGHCWVEQVGRQKAVTRAILTARSPSLAGSDSALPTWEPVESLVWLLCPVCDGACRAGSGFHRHHLYLGLTLVPLPAAALPTGTPSKQP